ncbi:hypothetical protein M8998_09830 [Sphingobacterium sp. lm-10]|uniref:hypothetical protein n=1 Tax=Sphingobacterium sp. lm-10 TaxID=2944904 RepID=UPI002020D901|nr:hypothetical protein [Sphingobacterium sp. lm-10]MCL7988236.1 hypothetical protein [Sphingobacterium sp. lm-10]
MRSPQLLKILSLCLLALPTILYAQQPRFSISPRIGYGVQNLDWSIAGNLEGTSPNIYSELIWDQVKGVNYGLQGTVRLMPNFHVILEGDYQQNLRGRARDTDYSGDNRTSPFYDERFSSDEGYFYNYRVSARYTLPDLGPISPRILLGYEQLGNRLFLLPLPGDTENSDLRTIYQTDWYGGQAALELAYQYNAFYATGSYGFGLYDYKARANWNLIQDFQQPLSFRHTALGLKHNGVVRLGYEVHPMVAIELTGQYSGAFTNTGLDELYTRSRGTLRTRFNGANLSQYSGSLGVRFAF